MGRLVEPIVSVPVTDDRAVNDRSPMRASVFATTSTSVASGLELGACAVADAVPADGFGGEPAEEVLLAEVAAVEGGGSLVPQAAMIGAHEAASNRNVHGVRSGTTSTDLHDSVGRTVPQPPA